MRNDVTRANAVSERKQSFSKLDFQLYCVEKCITKKASDDETRKHSRTTPDVQFKEFSLIKQKSRPITDYDWIEKTIYKKIRSKKSKNSKNQSEIAACEQKITTEKPNFCSNTDFSLYFKFRAKKFHTTKPLAFSLHFLFRRDQNHYSNLTSKIMKMCEQILKHSRKNSGSDSKHQTSQKTASATEAITFCIKPLTHYLPRYDLTIGEN